LKLFSTLWLIHRLSRSSVVFCDSTFCAAKGRGACLACHQFMSCFHSHLSASMVRAHLDRVEYDECSWEGATLLRVILEEPGVLRFHRDPGLFFRTGCWYLDHSLELD
jgi:hypothetical protein